MSYEENWMPRQRKMMFVLLIIYVLGFALTPYLRTFLGLLLGSSISLYNLWLLQVRVKNAAEAAKNNRKVKGLGTISRFAAAAFGVVITIRFDAYFAIIPFVIGLMTGYLVMVFDFFISRHTNST